MILMHSFPSTLYTYCTRPLHANYNPIQTPSRNGRHDDQDAFDVADRLFITAARHLIRNAEVVVSK